MKCWSWGEKERKRERKNRGRHWGGLGQDGGKCSLVKGIVYFRNENH